MYVAFSPLHPLTKINKQRLDIYYRFGPQGFFYLPEVDGIRVCEFGPEFVGKLNFRALLCTLLEAA